MMKHVPDEDRIFTEALRLTSDVIKGAAIMDVRLIDDRKNELFFAATHGPAWNEGSPSHKNERLKRRFPLSDEKKKSAGAHAIATGEAERYTHDDGQYIYVTD